MRAAVLVLPLLLLVASVPLRDAVAQDAAAPAPAPKFEYLYVEFTPLAAAEAVAVGKALSGVAGVKSVEWTVSGAEAKVVREVGLAGNGALVEPIAATTFVFVNPLHCAGCIKAVNGALRELKGVKDLTVAEDLKTVAVVYDTRSVATTNIEAALAAVDRPAKVQVAPAK